MKIEHKCLDDILFDVFRRLLKEGKKCSASKGAFREQLGAHIILKRPTARLSNSDNRGKLFSALGEFLWYMSGDNKLDFITYYISRYADFSDDQETIWGGYGTRLFKPNSKKISQIDNVINLLKKKPTSRQAVIQIFDAEDLSNQRKDIPCTVSIQFVIRDGLLNAFTYMRSNDAFWGLPHDVFAFTLLQEWVARRLGVKLGEYHHFVSSFHIYENKIHEAERYLDEGLQRSTEMQPMPEDYAEESLTEIMRLEKALRTGTELPACSYELAPFWNDIALLLKIFNGINGKQLPLNRVDQDSLRDLTNQLSDPLLPDFVYRRAKMNPISPVQQKLPFVEIT